MKRRRAVQKHGIIFDYVFENIPYFGFHSLDRSLRALYVMALILLYEFLHYVGLEKFDSHFFGKTALIEFKFGTYDDNRTTGIVYSFTEEVLTETTLFTAENSRQRFKISVARAGNGFASAAVVDKRVYGVLKHSLFVSYNDFGRAVLYEFFKTVVSVDNPSVKVVQIGRGKSAAVELNHRTKIGRNYGNYVEYHPFGAASALAERFDDIQPLDSLLALLTVGIVFDNRP